MGAVQTCLIGPGESPTGAAKKHGSCQWTDVHQEDALKHSPAVSLVRDGRLGGARLA